MMNYTQQVRIPLSVWHVRHALQLNRLDVFANVRVLQFAHSVLAVALQLLAIFCPGIQFVQFKHAHIPGPVHSFFRSKC